MKTFVPLLIAAFFLRATDSDAQQFILQPGPNNGKDIWTTSVYSYAPGGNTPGGGLNNEFLRIGGWGDQYYSLVEFDLTGLPQNAASATLRLYAAPVSGFNPTGFYLDRIIEFWDWRTMGTGRDRDRLWWVDRPDATQWTPTPFQAPTRGAWYDVDITSLFNAWQSGTVPNYGLQLRPTATLNNNFEHFYSSDYTDNPLLRPKLVIRAASMAPPHYTQGSGAAWADDVLLGSADPDDTLRKYGCFVSATSMLLNNYGHHTDPGKLNEFLADQIPGNNSILSFGSIPASTTYGQTDGTTGVPVAFHTRKLSLTLTRKELATEFSLRIAENGPLILRVPQYNDGLEHFPTWQHAILAWKVEDDEIFIRDPGSSRSGLPPERDIDTLTLDDYVTYVNASVETTAFRLDDDYQFLLPVTGQPVFSTRGSYTYAQMLSPDSDASLRGAAHSPVEFVITDPAGRRLGYNRDLGVSYSEIPGSSYERLDLIISPDGALMRASGTHPPIDFEVGSFLNGMYQLDVFGIGSGDWSINVGICDSTGFDPNQYLFAGIAAPGSHSRFSFVVPKQLSVTGFTLNPAAGTLNLIWVSLPGQTYAVEVSTNLIHWLELVGGIASQGNTTSFVHTNTPPQDRAFFRVRELTQP